MCRLIQGMGTLVSGSPGPFARGERPLAPGIRLALRGCALAGLLGIAFHLAHGELGLGGHGLDSFTYDWLYNGVVLGAAVSCLARSWLIRRERLPWLLLGGDLPFNVTGEICSSFASGDSGNPPIPSPADLFYLLY